MVSALVSGGNGFLGHHLIDRMLQEDITVTVVDDFSTSVKDDIQKGISFVDSKIEDFVPEVEYDLSIHLAARPSPEDYIVNPVETLLSNSIGTLKMLEIAKRSGGKFFYTSSSEIYGEAAEIPTPETYYGYVSCSGVRSCYDEGKRYSEALSMAYFRKYDLDVRIQRPFNVYGPGIREDGIYGRVIPRFIKQALLDEPITIHGTGEQTRSFLFVDDWVSATWKMLKMDQVRGSILNIGSIDEISILELAKLIADITGSKSDFVFTQRRDDDPTRRKPDISRASAILSWEPSTDLKKGLEKTIQWLRRMIR